MTMNTGRDRSGRFAKGNPGGPGRPRQTAERLAIKILDAIEPHLKAAVEATIAQAAAEASQNRPFKDMFDAWMADGVARKDGNAELRRSFEKLSLIHI